MSGDRYMRHWTGSSLVGSLFGYEPWPEPLRTLENNVLWMVHRYTLSFKISIARAYCVYSKPNFGIISFRLKWFCSCGNWPLFFINYFAKWYLIQWTNDRINNKIILMSTIVIILHVCTCIRIQMTVKSPKKSALTSEPQNVSPLEWRQNGLDSVSKHQPHDCLLHRLFRRGSKKTSKIRITGLCEDRWFPRTNGQ